MYLIFDGAIRKYVDDCGVYLRWVIIIILYLKNPYINIKLKCFIGEKLIVRLHALYVINFKKIKCIQNLRLLHQNIVKLLFLIKHLQYIHLGCA